MVVMIAFDPCSAVSLTRAMGAFGFRSRETEVFEYSDFAGGRARSLVPSISLW